MGAWEPIMLHIDTPFVEDFHQEEGQKWCKWTERRQEKKPG